MAFDVSCGKWFFNPGEVESFKQTCTPNRFVDREGLIAIHHDLEPIAYCLAHSN